LRLDVGLRLPGRRTVIHASRSGGRLAVLCFLLPHAATAATAAQPAAAPVALLG